MKLEKFNELKDCRYTYEECVKYGEFVNRFDYEFNNQALSFIVYDFNDDMYEFTMIDGIIINITLY